MMRGLGLFRTLEISASGLAVQRIKLDAAAENLANVETTKTETGEPYRRKRVVIKATEDREALKFSRSSNFRDLLQRSGRYIPIKPAKVSPMIVPEASVEADDTTPFTLRYEPGHPDADENGFVRYPNINVIDEMVDMVTASRAYEANVTAIQAAKDMFMKALEI